MASTSYILKSINFLLNWKIVNEILLYCRRKSFVSLFPSLFFLSSLSFLLILNLLRNFSP